MCPGGGGLGRFCRGGGLRAVKRAQAKERLRYWRTGVGRGLGSTWAFETISRLSRMRIA